MGRPVFTTADIDQAVATGSTEVVVDASAIITQLAREHAQQNGVRLVMGAAPEAGQAIKPTGLPPVTEIAPEHAAVKAAVIARLGAEPAGLDAAIARVMEG